MLIAGLLLLYIASFIAMRAYFRISFSQGGQWPSSNADFMSFFFTVLPFVNTFAAILFWLASHPKQGHEPMVLWNKFFGIKK